MRAIRVVWTDEGTGEVLKDTTVPYDQAIARMSDTVTIHGFGAVKLSVEFHFDPPVPR